jgi:hypothetical protein
MHAVTYTLKPLEIAFAPSLATALALSFIYSLHRFGAVMIAVDETPTYSSPRPTGFFSFVSRVIVVVIVAAVVLQVSKVSKGCSSSKSK